jgi:hypothetical protein
LFCFCEYSLAGDFLNNRKDNIVKLKAGKVLYAEDKVIVAQNDTIVLLPIYVDYYIANGKSNNIYQILQQKAYKNRWTKELHDIILVPEDSLKKSENIVTQKSEVPFLPFRNMVIRNIKIEKLNVFGPTINNPSLQTTRWIGRAGNKIHIKTKDGVINDHLIFKSGDLIDPNALSENERILRELPYIEDARIYIENTSRYGDSADLIVVVKDKFSKGFDLNIKPGISQKFEIWDNNIFGSGQEFENTFYNTPNQMPKSGIDGIYKIRNIGGSFINCNLGYNAYGNEGYNVNFSRDFFTQRTKYAGNLNFVRKNSFTFSDTSWIPLNLSYSSFWLGRAFTFNQFGLNLSNLNNIIISAGIYNRQFTARPTPGINYLYQYQNSTYYLASIAFSSQGYFKSNLVYNFGKTEDIPYGFLLKFTHGYEKNEFKNRYYNSVSLTKGNIVGNAGYLYGNIAFGGFTSNDSLQQGVLTFNTSFFTNLLVLNSFKVRHFINIGFVKGFNRYNDEILTINNLSGIRGFANDSAKGTQKLTCNFESVYFTPYYVLGFRIAAFVFADFGWVGKSYENLFNYSMYSGFGLGFRIRNEKLVFNALQIRFAYYPYLPKQAHGEFFSVSEQSKFRPSGFSSKSPEIIGF